MVMPASVLLTLLAARLSRRLPPIPCREDLALAAELYFKRTGHAAEVGTYRGFFSRHNLESWTGQYTMVVSAARRPVATSDWPFLRPPSLCLVAAQDYWGTRPNETVDNFIGPSDRETAQANVASFGSRVKLMQALSLHAATRFAAEHFDCDCARPLASPNAWRGWPPYLLRDAFV
jgi:hypothetical protein